MSFEPPRAFLEFRVLRPLGAGAMGAVWLAEDELLGREVAIKFVHPAPDGDGAGTRARFLAEARALARLSHPNVVAVHRVGEVLGQPFLVSELVKGESLDKVRLPLPPERALQVALQLARALAAVHRVGVLHRDLKPANVLVTDSGDLKLADFGVATGVAAEPEAAPIMTTRAVGLAETQPLSGATPSRVTPVALQVGTPLYAAPELLAGAPATRQSDLYGWGAVVYETWTGAPPHTGEDLATLRERAAHEPVPPLVGAPPALDALVRRCLASDPAARPARAEELLEALEPLAVAGLRAPAEPYRGLGVFGPEHAALFFGREDEARAVLERLRAQAFVVVAGDSGVGKTSFCRAGVLPLLESGALERRRFRLVELSPGPRPVEALAAALAPWAGLPERDAAEELRRAPEELAARVRSVPEGEGRALFVDALEELVSVAGADEAEPAARCLAALAARRPGFRLLATARSDSLTRLSALPHLGREIDDALVLLRPLTDEGLRQAIVGPARAAGFRFAPESLADELVASARVGPGALPLVQFALTELWKQRDGEARVIPREALVRIGGVGGALARHADLAVGALAPAQRAAAERVLRELVTPRGTRARRRRDELPPGAEVTRVLAQLTSARILIARGEGSDATWELAHDALVQSWDQLRAWLGRDAEKRALAQRIERAAEEWERAGAGREGLWSRRQLESARALGELRLGELERRFLGASRRGVRWQRARVAAVALLAPLLVAGVLFGGRIRAQAAAREQAAEKLRAGHAALESARGLDVAETKLAGQAFAAFDRGDAAEGERLWAQARAARKALEDRLGEARSSADAALLLSASDGARRLMADVLVLRLQRERGNPLSREREELLAQLAPLDKDGRLAAPFRAPARLRVDRAATLRPAQGGLPVALAVDAEREIEPGSYVLEDGATRLPLLLRHGERAALRLTPGTPPPGFIYVPEGKFLTGVDGDEDVRIGFFGAPPLHERASHAYFIARAELTFGEWLDWLRTLRPVDQRARLPNAETLRNGLSVTARPDGRFVLRIKPTTTTYEAAEGEPLVYPGRRANAAVDWRRAPVSGISFNDAQAYAAAHGARLCTEDEWERAARGADGRAFPAGATLTGGDANIDETYGREPLAFGPDAVGSHPASNSPVGAADMAGNVWELTVSRAGTPVIRGGSWWQGTLTARSANREPYEPTARDLLIGVRLCADARE